MERFAPENAELMVIQSLTDEDHPALGQVATVSPDGVPRVRTVHLHYLPEQKAIGFNTHAGSTKWTDVEANGRLSGCYFDTKREIQIRWESKAELIRTSSDKKRDDFLQAMWMKMREEVRAAYWLDHHESPMDGNVDPGINLSERSPEHGVILCRPSLWDIYTLDPRGYRHGVRTLYTMRNGEWRSHSVSFFH